MKFPTQISKISPMFTFVSMYSGTINIRFGNLFDYCHFKTKVLFMNFVNSYKHFILLFKEMKKLARGS